jgi:hypothetical protein
MCCLTCCGVGSCYVGNIRTEVRRKYNIQVRRKATCLPAVLACSLASCRCSVAVSLIETRYNFNDPNRHGISGLVGDTASHACLALRPGQWRWAVLTAGCMIETYRQPKP